jgi:hypothetical protein
MSEMRKKKYERVKKRKGWDKLRERNRKNEIE